MEETQQPTAGADGPGATPAAHRPDEPWRDELRLGLEQLREGEFEGAEHHFSKAHRCAPDRPEVCYALGRERLRRGRPHEAESLLRTAWAGDPSLVSAAATLARCLALHQHAYAEAEAIVCEAVERHGALALLDVINSEIALERGDFNNARLAAEAALAKETSTLASTTAAAARAALARVYNREGIELASRGELDTALFSFKRATHFDPRWSGPLVNMGTTFVDLGNLRAAKESFDAAIERNACNPLAHLNLARLLIREEKPTPARRHLERAIELDETLDEARTALARLLLNGGESDAACVVLASRMEQNSQAPRAWLDLGAAMFSSGDREGAEACFRQALALSCNVERDTDGTSTAALACRRLADLLARDGRYLEAAVLAQRAQEFGGDDERKEADRRSDNSISPDGLDRRTIPDDRTVK